MLSFLRARPDCGSAYRESKWAADELVRGSGLDCTIPKAGMIYGRGDHLIDHAGSARRHRPGAHARGEGLASGSGGRGAERGPGAQLAVGHP